MSARSGGRIDTCVRWIAILIFAAALFWIIKIVAEPFVDPLQQWIEGLGAWGPVALALIYIVATVALVPGSLLTIAAGAIFDLWVAFITISLGSTLGAAAAFLIARYVARSKVAARAAESPKFAAVDRAIGENGWKIVALLRLSPAIPFNLQNYFYGVTAIRFWPYVLTSWIAMMPGTFLYIYLAHVAAKAVTGEGGTSVWEWVLWIVGGLATIAATVLITRRARAVLRETTDSPEQEHSDAHRSDEAAKPVVGRRTMIIAVIAMTALAGAIFVQLHAGSVQKGLAQFIDAGDALDEESQDD